MTTTATALPFSAIGTAPSNSDGSPTAVSTPAKQDREIALHIAGALAGVSGKYIACIKNDWCPTHYIVSCNNCLLHVGRDGIDATDAGRIRAIVANPNVTRPVTRLLELKFAVHRSTLSFSVTDLQTNSNKLSFAGFESLATAKFGDQFIGLVRPLVSNDPSVEAHSFSYVEVLVGGVDNLRFIPSKFCFSNSSTQAGHSGVREPQKADPLVIAEVSHTLPSGIIRGRLSREGKATVEMDLLLNA